MRRARPHPLFWVLAGALVAAALAPGRPPAVALYRNPICRAGIDSWREFMTEAARNGR